MIITQEQFDEWKENPVTEAFLAHLADYEQHLDRVWSDYMRAQNDLGNPQVQHFHAATQGKRELIEDLRTLEADDLNHRYDEED